MGVNVEDEGFAPRDNAFFKNWPLILVQTTKLFPNWPNLTRAVTLT
jgi:hypothetical protein